MSKAINKTGNFPINVHWLLPHIHRRVRYTYFDLLDRGLVGRNQLPLDLYVRFDGDIEEHFTETERNSLVTILLILLNNDTENLQLNVHTHIFDQTAVIFSDDSVFHAYFVTLIFYVFRNCVVFHS